ncbi:hypothetical protein ACMFGS_27760 [Escherichia coli]
MQSDILQLAIAFAGYVCIGFCVYMISRKMLVDIDRKERAEEILVWIFFGAVWPLGINVCCNISSDVDIHPSR